MEKKQSKTKRETILGMAFGYDDGSSVFFYQRGEEDGAGVEIRYFANEEELWHFLRGLKNRSKSHDREFDINAGNIKVNLGYTARHKNERAASVLEDKKRCNELLKMLDSCGADEDSRRTLIEILSATLVGHLLRKLTEEEFLSYSEPVSYMTAPRLVCSPADGAADALRLVMESIVLNTAVPLDAKVKKGDVFNLMPPFLPKNGNESHIVDCAYALVCTGKRSKDEHELFFNERLEAKYRDTAVGIHTAFFRAPDIRNFVRRNRWATTIQVGGKCDLMSPIHIDGKILARVGSSDGWNTAAVHALIQGFLVWLYTKIKNEAKLTISGGIKKQLQNANRRIDEHNRRSGTLKYRGLQRLWLETQIVVLEELKAYMDMLGFWEGDEGQTTLNGWRHALLPSVYPAPVDNLPVDDPKHHLNHEADSQKLFRELLTAMVTSENCEHFMAVAAKGECPTEKVNGTDVWGYVRGFQMTGKDGHRYRVPTLQIREDVLTEAAPMLMPLECDWRTVIKTVREQQPDYLIGKSKNVRLPVDGESRLCATLVLSIEKLAWLPKTAQNVLLELTMLMASQN